MSLGRDLFVKQAGTADEMSGLIYIASIRPCIVKLTTPLPEPQEKIKNAQNIPRSLDVYLLSSVQYIWSVALTSSLFEKNEPAATAGFFPPDSSLRFHAVAALRSCGPRTKHLCNADRDRD